MQHPYNVMACIIETTVSPFAVSAATKYCEMTLFCTTSYKLYARSGFAYRDYASCTRYLTLESEVALEIGRTEHPNSQYAHAGKIHTNCLDSTVMASHAGQLPTMAIAPAHMPL